MRPPGYLRQFAAFLPSTAVTTSAWLNSRQISACSMCAALSSSPVRRGLDIAYPPKSRRLTLVALASKNVQETSSSLYQGAVVEVQFSGGKRRLAAAVRPDGKKNWIVSDAKGIVQSVAPKQITFHVGSSESLGDITEFEDTCLQKGLESQELVEIAWEIVSTQDRTDPKKPEVTVEEVAEIVFGDVDPKSKYIVHTMLQRDDCYFKAKNIKGNFVYEPRSKAQVTETKLLLEAARRREEERAALYERIRNAYNTADVSKLAEIFDEAYSKNLLSCVIAIAEDGHNGTKVDNAYESKPDMAFQTLTSSEKSAVRQLFEALQMSICPSTALDVLLTWKILKPHENLLLRKTGIISDFEFEERLLQIADEMVSNPGADPDAARRLDLRNLVSYAIDSADTSEIDDAFSWDSDKGLVWVHVADPTRYLQSSLENALVGEALRRTATLYLPTGKATMFPNRVAEDLFSLGATHGEGCALSFGFAIREDGSIDEGSITIVPSLVSRPKAFTYEEAEEALQQAKASDDLALLQTKAKARASFRRREGAIISNTPFPSAHVDCSDINNPSITLGIVDTSSASWALVSELMVAACNAAGIFAEDNGIPVMFRGQSPFEMPPADVLELIPEGPARSALLFKNATPSMVGLKASSHASLGLDCYVQVTSPIRRVSDLICHFQLKAALRGETPPFDEDQLSKAIARESDRGRTLRLLENKTTKYWQLEYFRRQDRTTEYDAIFVKPLREADKLGVVYLEKYALEVVVTVPSGLKAGTRLVATFSSIEPRGGQVRGATKLRADDDRDFDQDEVIQQLFSDIDTDDDDFA